jgi:hypothetical protein
MIDGGGRFDMTGSSRPSGIERLNKTVRFYRMILRISLTIMLFLFVRSFLSQLSPPTIGSLGAYVLFKLTLVGYMYCWFFGCNRDLSVQNDVLRDGPKPSFSEVGLMIVLVAAFAFLFYVEDPLLLSSTFLVFLTINVAGWVYLQHVARPFSRAAAESYLASHDRVGEIKVMLYEEYMFGRWQWWRFGVGFALLVLLAVTSFGFAPLPPGVHRDVAFALLALLALSVLEVWIWYKRLKLKIQWDGLEWLNERAFILPSGNSKGR